ncbi:MAG: hypothetical protein CME64_16305 [Halobacteriovoraceae bacterium]|nr:hypothetical protein [Halobacteriovoraceae bacterium]|tara:strand:+ start:77247 stop:77696 length:450 start_codon:yes stop_codon:yes gene_type:complete
MEFSQNDANLTLAMPGPRVDENFDPDISKKFEGKEVVFDFSNLNLMNSTGIREWLLLLENLKDRKITYKNCPKIFVLVMNMVKGVVSENVTVESFYVPFYDPETDDEIDVLMSPADIGQNLEVPEQKTKDGRPLEFDDVAEKYFQFLKM